MTKELVMTGATIEEATAAALAQLGLTEEDDYHVEVVKLPSKKILGLFGGSPAEVKVTYEAPDAPKAEKQPEKRSEKRTEKKPAPKKEAKPDAPKKAAPKAEKQADAPAKKPVEKALSFSERRACLSPAEGHEKTAAYLQTLVLGLGVPECTISAFENEDEILFELACGDDYGIVIGRRGETLPPGLQARDAQHRRLPRKARGRPFGACPPRRRQGAALGPQPDARAHEPV